MACEVFFMIDATVNFPNLYCWANDTHDSPVAKYFKVWRNGIPVICVFFGNGGINFSQYIFKSFGVQSEQAPKLILIYLALNFWKPLYLLRSALRPRANHNCQPHLRQLPNPSRLALSAPLPCSRFFATTSVLHLHNHKLFLPQHETPAMWTTWVWGTVCKRFSFSLHCMQGFLVCVIHQTNKVALGWRRIEAWSKKRTW